jgi:outer membrane immunogenic protein
MRLTILSGVVAVMSLVPAAGAIAADLPVAPAPAPLPPVLGWAGPYAGVQFGALFSEWDTDVGFLATGCGVCNAGRSAAATFGGFGESDTAAFGGVQAGYNWQAGALVFGVEGDIGFSGESARRNVVLPSGALINAGLAAITEPGAEGFNGRLTSSIDWLAAVRGRIGVTAGPTLFYATGGVAFAETNVEAGYLSLIGAPPGALVPALFEDDTMRVGWTVGAGIEALLTDRLSAKVEYSYADFRSSTSQLGFYIDDPTSTRQSVFVKDSLSLHAVKIGFNYRFAGP